MKQYKLLNNLFGWLAFAISATVYLLTVEPTASFWDCPEFITSAFRLEVGHPPGNTFFNLTGRFFANFAGGDVQKVALMINSMSALFSAGTILFLFWTITHLVKKIVCDKEDEMTTAQMITILGSGLVGSLVYTFSDTFWFSAVEAEVYAFSSFMTALVFWLILKWEDYADTPHADRYIILLSYIIGLSIGVHLLNLLCIPAIVLVYYFKKKPDANLKGTLLALVGSVVLIGLLLYGMIPGYVKLSGYAELLFVNVLHFGYNSGTAFYFLLVAAIFVWGLVETHRGVSPQRARVAFCLAVALSGVPFLGSGVWLGLVLSIVTFVVVCYVIPEKINLHMLNTWLLCLFVIFIGYSTFAQIIIRSAANPPMNQNAPNEIFSFSKYLNREQYGDRPLFYGYTFVSDLERDSKGSVISKQGEPIYAKVVKTSPEQRDEYVVAGYREDYVYTPELNMLMPRMYSKTESHVQAYKEWTNFKGKPVTIYSGGQNKVVYKPTFGENVQFFLKYQLNFMYWRYFMWNFSGRQNDEQGYGEVTKGNWITGFNFIDKYLVGDQTDLPADMRDNKGHNVYYMLPLLLGLIGLFYQAYAGQKGIQGFWVVFFLFFMTGIAIVIYLNQTPYQPRERDYAYAGSFYAFAIWVGFGVAALAKYLNYLIDNPKVAAIAVSLVCLIVPIQMAGQNWDDHDRSDRYTARDFGYNYLSCVDQDGIIFTNGDNDTFPLWYAQEVEGYRTDVRVCNLSYLQTDWYITQMKSPAYDSPALPIALSPADYDQAKLNYAYVYPMVSDSIPLATALHFLAEQDAKYKTIPGFNERVDYLPADRLYIPIDSAEVAQSAVLQGNDFSLLSNKMDISLKGKTAVMKNEIAMLYMLDGISRDGWKRPIYFATTVGSDMYMGLTPYFSLTGLANQITPINYGAQGGVNTEKMYDNMMTKFLWGGIDNPKVYLDENNRRMCRTLRLMFVRLIDALIDEVQDEKALAALDYCMKQIPGKTVPHDYISLSLAQDYYILGHDEQGNELMADIVDKSFANLRWFFKLEPMQFRSILSEVQHNLAVAGEGMRILSAAEQTDMLQKYQQQYDLYRTAWQRTVGGK